MGFVDKFIENLDGKMLNSSGGVHKGVADGEYTVGLTWEDPAANYVRTARGAGCFPEGRRGVPGRVGSDYQELQASGKCKKIH